MNNEPIEVATIFAKNLEKVIKTNLKEQNRNELQSLMSQTEKYSPAEIQKFKEEINDNYKQQISKLERINILIETKDVAALQQIRNVYELVIASDVKPARKDASITKLISLSTEKDLNVSSLTTEQAYLFCNATITLTPGDYPSHEKVVGTPFILDAAMGKTSILTEQLEILWEILDYCSDCTDDNMTNEEYMSAVRDSFKIISNYKIMKEQEQTQGRQL